MLEEMKMLAREYTQQLAEPLYDFQLLDKLGLWKYFPRWARSNRYKLDPIEEALPWMTYPAIKKLEAIIKPDDRIFEFGSGGSTMFFLKLGAQLTTVEHDSDWFHRVSARAQSVYHQWKGILAEPVPGASSEKPSSDLWSYKSSAEEYPAHSFEDYAKSIATFPDGFFDLVSIDGRSRPSCYAEAVSKVKQGGFIVLDNSEREEYRNIVSDCLARGYEVNRLWGPGPYNKYFWQTTFIRKLY